MVRVGIKAIFCPNADTKPYVAATIHNSLFMVMYVKAHPALHNTKSPIINTIDKLIFDKIKLTLL